MPGPLDAEFAGTQLAEFLSHLKNLQNTDGGWGFRSGGQSRVEPTCWAARALFSSGLNFQSEQLRKAANFLRSKQLLDGSWPATPEMSSGSWITSLACSVLADDGQSVEQMAAGLRWLCDDFPRDSTALRRFMRRIWLKSPTVSQSDAYRGWGWTPRTASWIEPTSFALMALRDSRPKQLPKNAAKRQELAISLLYDRMCPGGGWNCGNPRVYGVDGDSLVLPTCWALLALRDAPEKPGRTLSIEWLQKEFTNIESAASLAVARMTLENYGIEPPRAKCSFQDWSPADLAEVGVHVQAWVCLALDPARRWPAVSKQNLVGAPR